MTENTAPQVVRLTEEARGAVIDVLSQSFMRYPVMEFVLGPEKGQPERLRALIAFFTDVRYAMGWPVLGVMVGESLVAAALVNEPHDDEFLDRFQDGLDRVKRELGTEAYGRLTAFEQASEGNEPKESHLFVGMLGVLPEEQGRGYARLLLEHVEQLVQDAGVGGVALSTEDPANLPFYEHMGFEVIGKGEVGELSTWSLWWPNG